MNSERWQIAEIIAWDGRTFRLGDQVRLRSAGWIGHVIGFVSPTLVEVQWNERPEGAVAMQVSDLDIANWREPLARRS